MWPRSYLENWGSRINMKRNSNYGYVCFLCEQTSSCALRLAGRKKDASTCVGLRENSFWMLQFGIKAKLAIGGRRDRSWGRNQGSRRRSMDRIRKRRLPFDELWQAVIEQLELRLVQREENVHAAENGVVLSSIILWGESRIGGNRLRSGWPKESRFRKVTTVWRTAGGNDWRSQASADWMMVEDCQNWKPTGQCRSRSDLFRKNCDCQNRIEQSPSPAKRNCDCCNWRPVVWRSRFDHLIVLIVRK